MAVAPADPQIDEAAEPAFAAAAALCRRHGRGLYFASYFLTKNKRRAVQSTLAFCSMIVDAIRPSEDPINNAPGLRDYPAVVSPRHLASVPPTDESVGCGGGEIETRLAMFRDRLAEIYDGRLELPAVPSRSEAQHALEAFSRTVREGDIPQQYFLELAEGCRVESSTMRYATWSSLEKLLDQRSGTIGRIISSVLGVTHSEAHRQASKLGVAVGLTNRLQAIKADHDRGRIYLPLEDLARFRYSQQDLAGSVVNDSFRDLMRFEIARARGLFEQGAEAIRWLSDDGSRLAASAVVVTSSGALRAIEKANFDVLAGTPKVLTSDTLRRLPAAWRLARRREGEPMPHVF